MNIKTLEKQLGYKNDAIYICEYLGFNDTDQLKSAKFYSQEQSYSLIPGLGIGLSNNDLTWRLCRVVDNSRYPVDKGYKITIEICDNSGVGCHHYYQSDFLSLLEKGYILLYKKGMYVMHVKWEEVLTNNLNVIHEADIVKIDS